MIRLHAPPNSEARQTFVGASEVPAIMGVGYGTAYDVWSRIVLGTTVDTTDPMRIGTALEPVILDMVARVLGTRVEKPADAYVIGHLGANLDGLTPDGIIIEAKAWQAWDYDDALSVGLCVDDIAPGKAISVWLQMQAQMYCAGSSRAVLAALCDKRLAIVHVDADPATQSLIAAEVESFWARYVETRIAPPAVGGDVERLRRLPITDDEISADDLAPVLAELTAAKAEVKAAEARVASLDATIRERLGTARAMTAGGWRVSRTRVESQRLDTKRMQAEHPDLCATYTTTSGYDRLSIREPKR